MPKKPTRLHLAGFAARFGPNQTGAEHYPTPMADRFLWTRVVSGKALRRGVFPRARRKFFWRRWTGCTRSGIENIVCQPTNGGAVMMAEAHAKLTRAAGRCLCFTRGPGGHERVKRIHVAKQGFDAAYLVSWGRSTRATANREAFQRGRLPRCIRAACQNGRQKWTRPTDCPNISAVPFMLRNRAAPGPVVLALPEEHAISSRSREVTDFRPSPQCRPLCLRRADRTRFWTCCAGTERPFGQSRAGPSGRRRPHKT